MSTREQKLKRYRDNHRKKYKILNLQDEIWKDIPDNCVENLEWVTYSENNQHAIDTNLRPKYCGFLKNRQR